MRKLVDPAAAKDELREAETFQQVAERWLKSRARKGRAESYVHDNRRRIARLPKSLLETKARSISKGNITRVLDGIADRGKGAETNATHRMLSAILRWATSEGAISSSPAAGVEKRFEDEQDGRYFTDAETLLFWKGVGTMDRAEPGTKLAIKLCLVTAQRPIAIANLERRNVVLDGPWPSMTIVKDKIKGRVHVVPLPPLAVSLFRDAIALAGESAYVFPSPVGHDQPIDEHSLTRAITRNKADDGSLFGIPVTDDGAPKLYTCKKTVSTWLGGGDSPEAEGYLDEEIGLLLGHARTTVTARYNKGKYLAKKREMLEAWCRHLDDLINERGAANVVPFRAAAQGE